MSTPTYTTSNWPSSSSAPPPPSPEESQKRMMERLKWLIPLAVGGVFLLVILFIGGIFFLVVGSFRNSDLYKMALEKAQHSPEVVAVLGVPMKAGWLITGSMSTSGSSGHAELTVPLSGPQGKGTLYIYGVKEADQWRFRRLFLVVDGHAGRIYLVAPPPGEQSGEQEF